MKSAFTVLRRLFGKIAVTLSVGRIIYEKYP